MYIKTIFNLCPTPTPTLPTREKREREVLDGSRHIVEGFYRNAVFCPEIWKIQKLCRNFAPQSGAEKSSGTLTISPLYYYVI